MALWILLTLAGVQCAYWLYYFLRVSYFKVREIDLVNDCPPVSIVICFKGLPPDFKSNLQSIISQEYPDFEIVLVNDYSSAQDTETIFDFLKQMNLPRVNVFHATRDIPGKKQAQKDGVLAAKNEIILFTDIDCKPQSPFWIQQMVHMMNQKKADVVLGYGPVYAPPGFVAWFAGFETIMTALQYVGYHLAGETYMSVGRNWLLKKSLYLKYSDNAKGKELASGDDDLLLQALMGKVNITCCLHKESFMYSLPKTSLKSFLDQKTRHISASAKYPFWVSVKLFIFSFSITGYYILAVLSIMLGLIPVLFIVQITITKWLIQSITHTRAFITLDGKRYIFLYPVAEICLVFYYLIVSLHTLLKKDKKW